MAHKAIQIEVGVYSISAALAAQQGGADRVELCQDFLLGGTTPSAGAIQAARRQLDIELSVMIRPRGYDFCYSENELEVMEHDVRMAEKLGADGVVFGILKPNGGVDEARVARLIKLARPMQVTFHRAFDVSRDLSESLETLIRLGVDRVLTTGGENHTLEALDVIAGLVRQAGDRIRIMTGRTNDRTLRQIVAATGVREVHIHAPLPVESRMKFRNTRCAMGGLGVVGNEFAWTEVDRSAVRRAVAAGKSIKT
jgi:copper homeostasis protein